MVTSSSSTETKSQFSEAATINWDEIYPNGLKVYSFSELKTATKNFKLDALLGEGGFGRVFKGWVDEHTLAPSNAGTGMMVAIKKLNRESMQGFQEWQVYFSTLNFFESVLCKFCSLQKIWAVHPMGGKVKLHHCYLYGLYQFWTYNFHD